MAICWALGVALLATVGSLAQETNVQVGFYSEALCPGCDALAEGSMNQAVEKVGAIFDLNFVPWGNAELKGSGTHKVIECQHGPTECVMNIVENCVIHYYPQREKYWPYVICSEAHGYSQTLAIAKKCAEKSELDWEKLNTCQGSTLGHELALQAMNATNALNPPHTYTPWVTVNGKHIENSDHMITTICDAYTGTKPDACREDHGGEQKYEIEKCARAHHDRPENVPSEPFNEDLP